MDAFIAFLNDPQATLQLEYAVGAIVLGTFAVAGITELTDRRRARGGAKCLTWRYWKRRLIFLVSGR